MSKSVTSKSVNPVVKYYRATAHYVSENAWLQPFLLVGAIFVLIFNLTNIASWVTTVGTWIGIGVEEDLLTYLTAEEYEDKIAADDEFVVVFVQEGCSACAQFKPAINTVINAYPDENVVVYALDVTKDALGVYEDETLTLAKINDVIKAVQLYLDSENSSTTYASLGTPLMLKFEDGVVVDAILGATTSAAGDFFAIEEFLGLAD